MEFSMRQWCWNMKDNNASTLSLQLVLNVLRSSRIFSGCFSVQMAIGKARIKGTDWRRRRR
eukprot:404272-Amphidinium_carterae.1